MTEAEELARAEAALLYWRGEDPARDVRVMPLGRFWVALAERPPRGTCSAQQNSRGAAIVDLVRFLIEIRQREGVAQGES